MSEDHQPTILPCPWCGGEARVHDGEIVYVMCVKVGCRSIGPTCYDEQTAINRWNQIAGLKQAARNLLTHMGGPYAIYSCGMQGEYYEVSPALVQALEEASRI